MIDINVIKKIGCDNKYVFLFFISLIVLLLSAFAALKTNDTKMVNIWNGYITLLVEENSDSAEIVEILNNIDAFDEVICKNNTVVEYSNYYTIENITLDKLEKRFNPADPRITPFISGLSRYFYADTGGTVSSVYYLKTQLTVAEAAREIQKVFPDTVKWIIPGNNKGFLKTNAPLFIFIIIAAAFIVFCKKYALLYFFVSIFWVILLRGNSLFFYPSVIMLVLLFYLAAVKDIVLKKYMETGKPEYSFSFFNKPYIIIPLGSAAIFLIASVKEFTLTNYVSLFSAYIFTTAAAAAILFFSLYKASGLFHPVFCNVVIHPAGSNLLFENLKKIRPLYFFSLIYILSIATLPAFFVQKNPEIIMPAPYRLIESGDLISFETLKKISEKEKSYMFLPDFADYIKHISYQIRLPYDQTYRMPENGENITISNYKYNNNNFEVDKYIVTRFTESWLLDIIDSNRDNGIIGLMINDDGIIQAAVMDNYTPSLRLLFPVFFSLFYPVVIYLMFRSRNNMKYYSWKTMIPVIKRRKQQAA